MAVPHFGHLRSTQGTPRSCGSVCPHFGHRQGADSASSKGTTLATSTLSASTLSFLALALSRRLFPFHRVLFRSFRIPPCLCRSLSGAAGRDRSSPAWQRRHLPNCQGARLERPRADRGHERDHLDSIGGDQPVHRSGNCAANQGANTQLHQSKCLLDRQVFR